MGVWQCRGCGWEKEMGCKPRKCGDCGGQNINKKEGRVGGKRVLFKGSSL